MSINNKAKMIELLKQKMELGTDSDIYMCPDNAPEFMPYVIAAFVLTQELKQVTPKVLDLIQKSIEHDFLMSKALAEKPSSSSWLEIIFRKNNG